MAEETVTAAPSRTRTRAATKSTAAPAKATRSRAKAAPAIQKAAEDGREVYVFDLVHLADTKTYAKFGAPEGSACVGTFYAPLGTKAVKVKLTGGPVE